jgi:hypothetical protein
MKQAEGIYINIYQILKGTSGFYKGLAPLWAR